MIGAIAGDIIGSVYERDPIKTTAFPLFGPGNTFTDDTVLTVAVADAILEGGDYGEAIRAYARAYPDRGYGGGFSRWFRADRPAPYNSFGNGAAMRVSPVGFAFDTAGRVLEEAGRTAEITHNHPEGLKGARATALAVMLARLGAGREELRCEIARRFGYDLDRTVADIRPGYSFDVTCQGTVPEAIVAVLDSADWEDAVRLAVSLGGDSDTLACIAGAIAEAFYGAVPGAVRDRCLQMLDDRLRQVVETFTGWYGIR